jgi:hypothetical protein
MTQQHLTCGFGMDGIDIIEKSGSKDPRKINRCPEQQNQKK